MDFSGAEKEFSIGFLAQDVENAAKESGFNFPGIDVPGNNNEVYTLRYVDFIMPLVKAVQEQQEGITGYKSEITKLEAANQEQKLAIESLQNENENMKYEIGNWKLAI